MKGTMKWNGQEMTVQSATPADGYTTLENYTILIKDIQSTISSSGNEMFVLDVRIILDVDTKENIITVNDRRIYKAGNHNMNEVRDCLANAVVSALAKSGEKIKFVTDELILSTVKEGETVVSADIMKVDGMLNVTFLY